MSLKSWMFAKPGVAAKIAKRLEMMNEMGFKNVAAMEGGLRLWNANGLPMYLPHP